MKVVTAASEVIDLGTTETTPTVGIVDYSRRETDEFGVTTVVQRGFARRMSVRFALPFDQVDGVQRRLADLRATSARWVADDRFASLAVNGFFKDFELDLNVPPVSHCTLTVEGLTVTEPLTDSGADPAPDDQSSSLQLLRPAVVTTGALIAASVPEDDHAEWSAGATYLIGARVIRAATHRVYESLTTGNVGNDPAGAGATAWLDVGPTNRWAMFDQALGTATVATGVMAVTLSAGFVNAVALLDVTANTVRVQAPGYDRTVSASGGTVTFLDVPATTGQVTVTIAGSGPISVGTLLAGQLMGLGITEASPTAGITDFSRKEVDDFGEVTIVQRAWAKRMTARALIETTALDDVMARIAAVRARPVLWIGKAGTDALTIYGFFRDFSIEVDQNVSKLSLSIEGLSTAAPPSAGLPAATVPWTGVGDEDPTRPRPQDGATVGAPTGTNVAGVPAQQLIDDLDQVIENLDIARQDINIHTPSIFDLAKTVALLNGLMQAKTTLDGKPIGTVVSDVRTIGESTVEELHLIGAKNGAGTAFLMNLGTVQVAAGVSLAQRFDQLEAHANDAASAVSTSLSQAIADEAEQRAIQINTVRAELEDGIDAATQSTVEAFTSADEALAQRIDEGEANFGDLSGQFTDSLAAQADINGATSDALAQVAATLEGPDGLEARTSFLMSAAVDVGGGTVSKAVLSLVAGPAGSLRVAGIVATNTGETSTLDLDFDSTRIFQPDGELLFEANGDGVFMPRARVTRLTGNAAVIPITVIRVDPITPTGRANYITAATATFDLPERGVVEVSCNIKQDFSTQTAYGFRILLNGSIAFDEGAFGDQDFIQIEADDEIEAGAVTAELQYAADAGSTLKRRSMKIRAYPNTEG
ncbi:hypothetical protein PQ455_07450 [Sphingomonas naphthae]|uniref:DUF1983 domain-containing protein n=1 Tax=Sphingomonas naphthae TaxID=1813468 RepID=A0ABY7TQU0_9SPHN|nr:hypothetical protein [Sphingomonas naphthae]WCT75041.1 hypothetical protein PQ455_07450 [Sphingomonas naphthae]